MTKPKETLVRRTKFIPPAELGITLDESQKRKISYLAELITTTYGYHVVELMVNPRRKFREIIRARRAWVYLLLHIGVQKGHIAKLAGLGQISHYTPVYFKNYFEENPEEEIKVNKILTELARWVTVNVPVGHRVAYKVSAVSLNGKIFPGFKSRMDFPELQARASELVVTNSDFGPLYTALINYQDGRLYIWAVRTKDAIPDPERFYRAKRDR